MKHPIQPVFNDDSGVDRFFKNAIVRRLLDEGPFDMNQIATWDVSDNDREQFAQLIGYSLGGFGELDYVKDDTYDVAERMAREGEPEELATVRVIMRKIAKVRGLTRKMAVELFSIHPDDLE